MTSNETKLVNTVAAFERWESFNVTRRSDREFDLMVEGIHKQFGGSGCRFSARLPLAAIHCLCQWWQPNVASMTDYPSMATDGDWSAVRDTSEGGIWKIFDAAIVPKINVFATVAKIKRKMTKA